MPYSPPLLQQKIATPITITRPLLVIPPNPIQSNSNPTSPPYLPRRTPIPSHPSIHPSIYLTSNHPFNLNKPLSPQPTYTISISISISIPHQQIYQTTSHTQSSALEFQGDSLMKNRGTLFATCNTTKQNKNDASMREGEVGIRDCDAVSGSRSRSRSRCSIVSMCQWDGCVVPLPGKGKKRGYCEM